MNEELNEVEQSSCCGECNHDNHDSKKNHECCGAHETEQDDITDEEEMNLLEEIAKLNDQLLRNKAELENFKRRMNEERIKDNKYRSQNLATAILPALDTFERAMSVQVDNEEVKNFLVGFEMIHKQFVESLSSEGIEVIKAEGEAFDPFFHQAVMQEEVEGTESGIVLMEMQKGYKLKDRVIRPAMVKVSQ